MRLMIFSGSQSLVVTIDLNATVLYTVYALRFENSWKDSPLFYSVWDLYGVCHR